MKFIFILAVAIVVVSGKSIPSELDAQHADAIQNTVNKEIVAPIQADPRRVVSASITFLMGIDTDVRTEIIRTTRRTTTIMVDTSKTFEERFIEIADLHRDLADLWNQAANKYVEVNTAALSDVEKIQLLKEYSKTIGDEQPHANPQQVKEDAIKLVSNIDAAIWAEMVKDTGKSFTIMIDTSKPLKARYTETAEITQHTAELWKQAAIKIKAPVATNAVVTEASAPIAAQ